MLIKRILLTLVIALCGIQSAQVLAMGGGSPESNIRSKECAKYFALQKKSKTSLTDEEKTFIEQHRVYCQQHPILPPKYQSVPKDKDIENLEAEYERLEATGHGPELDELRRSIDEKKILDEDLYE